MTTGDVDTVKRMWSAFQEGGLEAALEFFDEHVEWADDVAAKTTVHGHDGFREAMGRLEGEGYEVEAEAESFEACGEDGVLAQGYIRLCKGGSYTDLRSYWAYRVAHGKIVRGASYSRRREALEAAGLSEQAG